MIVIRMRDNLGFRFYKSGGITDVDQDVGRFKIDDATEASDIMGPFDIESVEGKVGKCGVQFGFRVAGQKPLLVVGVLRDRKTTHETDAAAGKWITLGARAIDQKSGTGIG